MKTLAKWISCVAICLVLTSTNSHGEQVTVNLANGTIIIVEANLGQKVPWKTIDDSGTSIEEPFTLGLIKKINLTDQPASAQIAKVRMLLDLLDSDSYRERQSAQKELSSPDLGIPFRELIEMEEENESLEVSTRVKQILSELRKDNDANKKPEFDILYLKNGKSRRGDVGEFVFKCEYRGQELNLKRDTIRRLSAEPAQEAEATKAGPLVVEPIHKHQDEFYADPERVIDFDSVDLPREKSSDLTKAFLDRGVIMDAEGKAFVGLSGYPFKYPDVPTGGESACVVDSTGIYDKRFEGIMQFTFCVPGLPDSPAGVNEFGLFLSRVDHARDFILEAYNAESQLLGTTQSTDELCGFLGVRSNEPIAFVRVLSNPYLFEVDRKVDKNYAIDNIWFGAPQALSDSLISRRILGLSTVSLKNGEFLGVESIRFKDDVIQVFDSVLGRQINLSPDEVTSIRFAPNDIGDLSTFRQPIPTSDDWLVMLKDRSVLKVDPGKNFNSALLNGRQLDPAEIMAIWSERDQMRFPSKGDFTDTENVLVFPTCSWQTTIDMTTNGISWQQGKKLEQPIYPRLEREEQQALEAQKTARANGKSEPPSPKDRREDVTPKFNSFKFARRTESQMPTVWLSEPEVASATQGFIFLIDGQQVAVPGKNGLAITELNKRGVTLSGPGPNGQGEQSITIPTTDIRSIRFPK